MSASGVREVPLRYARSSRRRKTVLNLDLNDAPPTDTRDQEGPSIRTMPVPPAAIDVEAIDDEVVESSATAFAAARNNSRRIRGRTVVDVDLEVQTTRPLNNRNKRRRAPPNQTIINDDRYINLESSNSLLRENKPPEQTWHVPPLPPKEPTFNCPICMGQLVDEMSTKCGHIFCKMCIKAAISAQGKCPTCRKRVTMKDTIRIYLPAAS
ncbi:E3 ubiquitin-protein ligase RNF4 [Vitis riparia]|uniref:E3 ubiquitin-protein ligase RNF4 n=1 Tax=Vitis riparia TaxID=96939 RepID=UPI00155A9EA1|nr:E3 ubiquitin-protein ligase RNF4 [Vitis riparia]